MQTDEQAIHNLVDTWLAAAARGDVSTMLNLLADVAHVSEAHFIRTFKATFGVTLLRDLTAGIIAGCVLSLALAVFNRRVAEEGLRVRACHPGHAPSLRSTPEGIAREDGDRQFSVGKIQSRRRCDRVWP